MTTATINAMRTGADYENNAGVMLLDRLRRSPERVALVADGREISYRELGVDVARAAARLRSLGVGAGDRVAVGAANRPEIFHHLAATLHLGAIFVPLNTRLSGPELRFILDDAGVSVLILEADIAREVTDALDGSGVGHRLLLDPEPLDGWTSIDPAPPADGAVQALGPSARTDAADVAVLMYTSGTTGDPKGAMISHGNIFAAVHNLQLLIPMGPESGLLAMAPVFHIGAMALALGALATGGRVVLLEAFDPGAVLDALTEQVVTFTFGVPAMLQMIADQERFAEMDLSGVLLMCAGAPVPESLLIRYLDRGANVTQGYGLTESTAVVSLLESDFATEKLGSAGMPYPLTGVEIRDPAGRTIHEPGVDGEIWISGRNVVRGYWNRPEDSAALVDGDGWLRTGDAGHLDEDGFLHITDRIKDMLITGGENVYPAEVEKVLAAHPAVADVAVIGRPDDRWGETVTAVVVPVAGAEPDLEDLQAHARTRLAGYKIPRRLELVDELPRNASGKVLKRRLRTGTD